MDLKIEKARVALSDMDDYSRMAVGINPVGARAVIETFINDAERIVQALASKDAEIARLKSALETFANIAYFSNIVDGFVMTLDDIDQQAALQKAFATARAALTQPTEQP